ncbi:hypothetical protein Pcinc_016246 [Petrolisthes cinctipes]|uniref:UmuC domain-containing protein n=1 Tax=Petrolisthes cinctipes TaxID=88211 RepID=A0AAE1FWN4_PETCI|nr:hypothetical protein Pcinc_016246 [Petrolisthes cinctipes]
MEFSDELECGDEGLLSPPHTHQRTILHLDADCFYAQVEMVRQPELRDKPLGIKQKNLVVTCNYVARSQGVKKCMWLKEAMEVLPELVLVDGSDLTHYRRFSTQISGVAQSLTHRVERLGLDENFIDVTDLVDEYMNATGSSDIEGHVFGDKEPVSMDLVDPCGCGCRERLVAGSLVAKQLREQILKETGITVCAARSIPGIGSTTFSVLKDLGISTVQELQDVPLKLLRTKFDSETCSRLKEVSNGIDETSVKKSGKAQSVGLEDAFTKVNSVAEVKVKYQILLERLLKLLREDGRVPVSIRVSVRKFDLAKRFGHRETRQTSISSSLFPDGVNNVGENTRSSLMKTVMGLFQKMVDTSKDFHLTLVGVAFNKLIERVRKGKDISSFFGKRTREETTETYKYTTDNECKRLCVPLSPEKSSDGHESIREFEQINMDKLNDKSLLTSEPLDPILELESTDCRRVDNNTEDSDLVLKGIDPEVFRSLPEEIKQEVLKTHACPDRKSLTQTPSTSPVKTSNQAGVISIEKSGTIESNGSGHSGSKQLWAPR